MYEATLKSGRSLHERAKSSHDRQHLENLLAELKDKWDTISGKSLERYGTPLKYEHTQQNFFQMNTTKILIYPNLC